MDKETYYLKLSGFYIIIEFDWPTHVYSIYKISGMVSIENFEKIKSKLSIEFNVKIFKTIKTI